SAPSPPRFDATIRNEDQTHHRGHRVNAKFPNVECRVCKSSFDIRYSSFSPSVPSVSSVVKSFPLWSETMQNVIELANVTKRYGQHTALDDVSLSVPPGVVFALLGENGAGKTTAIRLMLGLTEPSAGGVRVLDLDSQRDGFEIRRRVGYLPERPTLYEWM